MAAKGNLVKEKEENDAYICMWCDSGANVQIANNVLSIRLINDGYNMFKEEKIGRQIKTAGKSNRLVITGWIHVGGFIKEVVVVPETHDSLLSLVKLAASDIETRIRPDPYNDCNLYYNDDIIAVGQNNAGNNLFYFDIRNLMGKGIRFNKRFSGFINDYITVILPASQA